MARHDAEAFHFPARFEVSPGLYEQVQELYRAGRERSALDLVLRVLRRDGRSAGAFQCALVLCAGRTAASAAHTAEPITGEQLSSPYLAPVATECVSCQRHWYSSHTLVAERRMAVSNPIGLQCQVCRYTLCRGCLPPSDRSCPEPGCAGTLGTPVLPTGRPLRQPANQHVGKVEYVLVLWSGACPDPAEIDQLLGLACTWQDQTGIRVTTVEDPEVRQGVGEALVYREESDGRISPGSIGRLRSVLIDDPETGRRRVFVAAADPTATSPQAG
ncbi:MAG TPA: hypothetical protein VLJ59_15315 [Mycobacteriales bacterium]|nr:hypothetical protein [Mycobacteriales bacterium]